MIESIQRLTNKEATADEILFEADNNDSDRPPFKEWDRVNGEDLPVVSHRSIQCVPSQFHKRECIVVLDDD
jgi:hypothetical protein